MSITSTNGTLKTKHGIRVHAKALTGDIYQTPCGLAGHVEEDGVELEDKEFEDYKEEKRCDSCEELVFSSAEARTRSKA